MEKNPLKIVSVEAAAGQNQAIPSRRTAKREETQARMERLWHQNPEQFNPLRNCVERERLERTLQLIQEHLPLPQKKAADLGCAAGVMSRMLRDSGAKVDSVDAATIALNKLKEDDTRDITPIHDCLPETKLKDDAYDLVMCTEVIAYLNQDDYRVLFAELSRLIHRDGFVVCSTPLDINTEDPLERFAKLAETELKIDQWKVSYHLLHIRFCQFFEAPFKYIEANKDHELRNKELDKRSGLSRIWFKLNTTPPLSFLWYPIHYIFKPIVHLLKQNRTLMLWMERMTNFWWSENGISHATFIGKRRPLFFPLPPDEVPKEMKHKRQVWE